MNQAAYMIIGFLLAYAVLIILAVGCLVTQTIALVSTIWLTARIKTVAVRYLCRTVVVVILFVPTFIPYDGEALLNLNSFTDFIPSLGAESRPGIMRIRLASYVFLKGFLTENPTLMHAGGVPCFLAIAVFWCSAMALKYWWPVCSLIFGTAAALLGSSWLGEAKREVYRTTFDPFVIALTVLGAGLTLCVGAVLKMTFAQRRRARGLKRTAPVTPPPIPPLTST